MKNKMPSKAPGNVIALTRSTNSITYGNNARKYDALPEL